MPGASLGEEAVVRVGEIEYPRSLARYILDSYIDLAEIDGTPLTEEEMQEAVEMVKERLIAFGVIESRSADSVHLRR